MSKSERTRQFIIEKVAPIFNRQGYAGTALSDLTNATGLTKGAIYGNFENKEAVALAAFNYSVGLFLEGLRAELSQTTSAVEQLLIYPRYYAKSFTRLDATGGCPILNGNVDADDAPESALTLRVKASLLGWRQHIINIIEQGKTQGEIRPTADGARYATLFVALMEGGVLLAHSLKDPSAMTSTLAHVEDLILRELKA
jgi:AcrR family transcriptional regulator